MKGAMYMKIVTINREYGSGGRRVAFMLSEKLGISCYDSNLLMVAGERYGINPDFPEGFDEQKSISLLYGISLIANNWADEDRIMLPYRVYQAQVEAIRRLEKEAPCIFVGCCANEVLKDEENVLRVFIYASDMEERIERISRIEGISREEAAEHIARTDRQRRDDYYFHTGQEWDKKENYDICLNTSTLGMEGCVNIIAALAKKTS